MAPTTTVSGRFVDIAWQMPFDGSSPILGYRVEIRQSDGITFTEEPLSCNGYDSAIKLALKCSVPLNTLVVPPYSLPWGSEVYARVTSINIVGESLPSTEGNGAIILAVPNAPLNLVNVPEITSGRQIGLQWDKAAEEGGTGVLDFTINYADSNGGTYSVYQAGVLL